MATATNIPAPRGFYKTMTQPLAITDHSITAGKQMPALCCEMLLLIDVLEEVSC
jgi:hypothetical protein